jgi:hypothetical protein
VGCRDRALPLFAGCDHHEQLAVKHGISTQGVHQFGSRNHLNDDGHGPEDDQGEQDP